MININTLKSLFVDTRQHSLFTCEGLSLEDMALQAATFTIKKTWTDEEGLFNIHYLSPI